MNRVFCRWGRCLLTAVVVGVLGFSALHASAQQTGSQWTPRRPETRGTASFSTPNRAPMRQDSAVVPAGGSYSPSWQETPRMVSRPVQSAAYQEPAPMPATRAPEVMPTPTPMPADDVFGSSPHFMPHGEVYHEGPMGDAFADPFEGPAMYGDYGGDCHDCGPACGHGPCSGKGCWLCIPLCGPCGIFGFIHESSVFGGVHAFKGPLDQGRNGNFGFQEGFNFGGCLFDYFGVGYQVGANFVQSNLSGDVASGAFRTGTRHQTFMSIGLYHRAWDHWGWQYGVVYDYVDDNYYSRNQVGQMRFEAGYLFQCGHEFGVWGAYGARGDTDAQLANANFTVQATDMTAFYYRRNLCSGGQGRVWIGGTDDQDTILGADFRVPLSNRVDMVGGFNYLAPQDGNNNVGQVRESWGMSMQMVWYFGRCAQGVHNTQYRPLFNVADNNILMMNRLQQ